jgi:hypothetical protein
MATWKTVRDDVNSCSCDVHYDCRIKTMFCSSLSPGLMSYLRYLCFFTYSVVHHILCCVFVLFVFVLYFVCPMLSVSLNCPFLIAPSVFSNCFHYLSEILATFRENRRGNQEWTIQRHRQQRAQDTERIETKLKHNTENWRGNQKWTIQRHRQQQAQDTVLCFSFVFLRSVSSAGSSILDCTFSVLCCVLVLFFFVLSQHWANDTEPEKGN